MAIGGSEIEPFVAVPFPDFANDLDLVCQQCSVGGVEIVNLERDRWGCVQRLAASLATKNLESLMVIDPKNCLLIGIGFDVEPKRVTEKPIARSKSSVPTPTQLSPVTENFLIR